jgi:very-long-chain ceramide synthase
MLKYLGYQTVCDIMFGLFMVVWFIGRHVFYMMVCWSIHYDIPKVVRYGRYPPGQKDPIPMDQIKAVPIHELLLKPFWYNVNDTYWTPGVRDIFLGLLLFLQVITIIWFFMICRVAAKFSRVVRLMIPAAITRMRERKKRKRMVLGRKRRILFTSARRSTR